MKKRENDNITFVIPYHNQNMIKVSKYIETKMMSSANITETKMETKVLWKSMGDYIRWLSNYINRHLTNKYIFEIISGRVFFANYGELKIIKWVVLKKQEY